MICFRCNKPIDKNDNYFVFQELDKQKEISKNYAHKECWNSFLKSVSDTTEAMGVVRGLKSYFTRMGVIEPEEVVIR